VNSDEVDEAGGVRRIPRDEEEVDKGEEMETMRVWTVRILLQTQHL
jgi:hypothetical protein